MKRLKLFFACLLMAVLSIGQVWATDEVVYTLTPVEGSDNGYATNEDIDIIDGETETTITWNVTGNATMTPWRIGGKNLSGVNREVYSKDAMSAAITKVELTVGTASSVTVNSLKLIVASDEDFSDVIDEVTEDFTASSTITFEPTSPATKWATGAYYKFVFNVTIGGNNKYVQFTEAKFYAEAAAPAYTITAQSNDNSKGTVSLSGSVITGSPKAGFRYASPAYTVTSGTATVAQSGNAFTVTPSSDCTVRINFEAIPQYTVTWNNNGSTSTSQVLEGNKPVFPATPAACDATSTTFIGWATAPWDGKLANLSGKTVYTSAAAMPDVDAAVTYYAVFAKSSGSAGNLFEWEGGTGSALTALENVTASGLGSDYAAGNAPYRVKFDTEGDYIVITTSGAIESVAVGVKMLGGGSTSHIYVQEAEDAESDFSAVETLTISGAQNDVLNLETENAFKADSRAVKLLFNKGSNVGVGPITIAGAASASDYMTTCCTKRAITIASGIENGTVSADPTSACEGATVTLTFTPAGGYHLDSWSVNSVAQDISDNTFTMPDEAVTVSATFVHDDCTNLLAPTLDGVTKTYNSATIAWNEVADAEAYAVSVVKDGEAEPVFSGNVNALSKALADLEPETQYNYTIMAVGDGTVKCADGNGLLEGNFTTNPLPMAHLTLMNLGVEHASSDDYAILTPFNLPTTAAACSKAFVGWDADADCAVAPTYAKGESFQFNDENDVTLYAVYADVTGGGASSVEFNAETYAGANGWEEATAYTTFTINGVTFTATGGANDGKYYTSDKTWRLYNGGSLSISATGVTISSVSSNPSVSFAEDNGIFSCSFTATTKFKSITVNVAAPETYENYSTECAAPLADPTFSLDPVVAPVNDKYEEAINVVITNNAGEGTIYYTLDDTDPTSSSTRKEYTGTAITLNACGSTTIKAIAISATNQSGIASATYEIAIPVPTNSQLAPYSPTEAREVIDGGCYDGTTIMYVKGVVKTCSAWNSNYGNYDVVVRNIGNEESETFTYFRMYAASGNTKFDADEEIAAGDTILAAGVLTLYGSTYEFAQNTCYMVEHKKMVAPKTSIANEPPADPYTVAQAINFINNAVTYDLSEEVYVKGVVTNVNTSGTKYIDVKDAGQTNSFRFYNCNFGEFTISENDTIICKGILYKHNATYEFNGCTVTAVTPYVAPVVAVTGVELDQDAVELEVGEYVELEATVNPSSATNKNITWESDDETVATVVDGLVTAIAAGSTTITVTTEEGSFTATCTVTVTSSSIPENTDIITAAKIGVEGNSYAAWENKTGFGTSSVYAGNSTNATNPNTGAIQLRYNTATDKQSGIVLTSSNGLVLKGLSVTVKSGTNTLNVYAKNTAYDGYSDLYSSDEDVRGKLIGTVSATGAMTLQDGISYNDNYQYIGMRSNNGALYLTDITITWGDAYVAPTVYTVTFNSNGGSDVDAADVNEGDAVAKPADPTREGYTFNYWTLNEVEYDFDTPVTDDITLVANWTENPAPSYGSYERDGLTPGNYATICLPKAGTIANAQLFDLEYFDGNNTLYLLEVNGNEMVAGRPYIFLPSATTIVVTYTSDATAPAGSFHGLVGSFSLETIDANAGNYILWQNAYYFVDSQARVGENRAYIHMGDVPTEPSTPQLGAAPRRRVGMAVHGEQTATGIGNVQGDNVQCTKVLIDGQLFILRGEKMYNANGQVVK